jgi:acyl-CoA synthetase (AMP-forming)/AMP-acid ligase II
MKIGPTDRCVSWLPWYHDMGLVGCFLSPIGNQFSVDYLKTEDFARRPLAWLDLISRNPGTTVSYSPTFGYDICARARLQPDQRRRALRPVALADRRQRRRHDPARRDAGLRQHLSPTRASRPALSCRAMASPKRRWRSR